ncbi:MAG: hypothetical protein IT342_21950 [Candidatus Melainabacteria bacterium]|nr:hypothetical protein [Candidatus Melainabacteria bacterium]
MADDEKYGGTATCTVKMQNGETKQVSCNVSFTYASSSDAETALNAAINAQISQSGGTKDGSVSLSVSKKF